MHVFVIPRNLSFSLKSSDVWDVMKNVNTLVFLSRPWSHVYSEREAAKLSQSVCRLAMTSVEDGGVAVEGVPGGEGPRSLPYIPSNMQSSTGGFMHGLLCWFICNYISIMKENGHSAYERKWLFSFWKKMVYKKILIS